MNIEPITNIIIKDEITETLGETSTTEELDHKIMRKTESAFMRIETLPEQENQTQHISPVKKGLMTDRVSTADLVSNLDA